MKFTLVLTIFLNAFLAQSQITEAAIIDQRHNLKRSEIVSLDSLQIASVEAVKINRINFYNLKKEIGNKFGILIFWENQVTEKWEIVSISKSEFLNLNSFSFITEVDGNYKIHFLAENNVCSIVKIRSAEKGKIGSATDYINCPN